jgi:hypothetical protein
MQFPQVLDRSAQGTPFGLPVSTPSTGGLMIAHELNNIAGVIAMATELLKDASTPERHETLLRLIDDAVARISGVASRALEMPA